MEKQTKKEVKKSNAPLIVFGLLVVLAGILIYNRPVVVSVPEQKEVKIGAIQKESVCSHLGGFTSVNDRVYLPWGLATGTLSMFAGTNEDMTLLIQTVATGTNNPAAVTITPYLSYDQSVYYQGALSWNNTAVSTSTITLHTAPKYQVWVGTGTTSVAVNVSNINAPYVRYVFELGTSTSITSNGAINVKACHR